MELRKILKRLNICDTLYSQEDAGAALAAMLYTFNHVGLGFDESPAALAALSSEQFLNRRPSRFHLRFKITTTYDTSKGGQDDPVTDPILLDEENRSVRYETGTMLQLQFPPLAAEEVSLDTLMTYFRTRNYPVEEVETAKCRQGDRYYPAARRVRVETEIADSAPRLILLSRYVYREATKTDEAAPVQVKSRVTMPDQIAGKRLLAVIRHYGTSPRNGHYVAAIRENEQWYLANDHYVRLLSVEETRDMIAAGYIYYYG
jgi:hypothetical protein